jgi:hypothetical protein
MDIKPPNLDGVISEPPEDPTSKDPGGAPRVLDAAGKAFLLSNYKHLSFAELSTRLGVSISTIRRYLKQHGIVKGTAFESVTQEAEHEIEDSEFGVTIPATPPSASTELPAPPVASKVRPRGDASMPATSAIPPALPEPPPSEELFDAKKELEVLLSSLSTGYKHLAPAELWDDPVKLKDFLEKFIILKRGFSEVEWKDFISHWARYMSVHSHDFNEAEDFDDLSGMIKEMIMQSNIFAINKTQRTKSTFYQIYTKQYDDSVKRMLRFQTNLQLSRKVRKEHGHNDKASLAEIVALFESEDARNAMIQADHNEHIEMLSFVEQIQKRMRDEIKDEQYSGQETAVLLGMDAKRLGDITDNGVSILGGQG